MSDTQVAIAVSPSSYKVFQALKKLLEIKRDVRTELTVLMWIFWFKYKDNLDGYTVLSRAKLRDYSIHSLARAVVQTLEDESAANSLTGYQVMEFVLKTLNFDRLDQIWIPDLVSELPKLVPFIRRMVVEE